MRHVQLAIVGGGPAGLAAAAEARAKGLSVALLDEQPAPGGQIYRQVEKVSEAAPHRAAVLGKEYLHGATLVRAFRQSGAHYFGRSLVWQIERDVLWYLKDGEIGSLRAARILIATGALERPVPLPGWTLPGVMTAGAAQILLKESGLIPGEKTVLVGHGPLLLLLAQQLLAAGGSLGAIVETVPSTRYFRALRHLPAAMHGGYLAKGLRMMLSLRRAGVRFYRNAEAVRIEGESAAQAVSFRVGSGTRTVPASHVFLHEGVIPNAQLPRSIGCRHRWDSEQHCFRPIADDWGNTSVQGIMVAGDGAGIGGARAAEEAGRIAALEAARALGRLDEATRDLEARKVRARLERQTRGRRLLEVLYAPSSALPRAPDTLVCRCEEVTAGAIRAAVRIGGRGPNQIKSYLRCGMGPCQGRMCGPTVTQVIADELHLSPQEVGYFRIRPPLKPLPLGALAADGLVREMEGDEEGGGAIYCHWKEPADRTT